MTYYVKSKGDYDKVSFDREKVRAAAIRLRKKRKKPTSVALDPMVIKALRREAESRGLPYQVLMRMLIVQGLKTLQKTS